jgi:hypothetical protein
MIGAIPMSILKKVSAFKRKAVAHPVNDTEFNFYPVRIGRLLTGEIRDAVAPIVQAVSTLLSSGANVSVEEHTQVEGAESDAPGAVYTNKKEMSVGMVKWLEEQRTRAVKSAVIAIIDPKTSLVIGRVLADSLRDDFKSDASDEEIQEFMDALDLKDVGEFCLGFLKANAEVFGFDEKNRDKAKNLIRDLFNNGLASAAALKVIPADQTEETEVPAEE